MSREEIAYKVEKVLVDILDIQHGGYSTLNNAYAQNKNYCWAGAFEYRDFKVGDFTFKVTGLGIDVVSRTNQDGMKAHNIVYSHLAGLVKVITRYIIAAGRQDSLALVK